VHQKSYPALIALNLVNEYARDLAKRVVVIVRRNSTVGSVTVLTLCLCTVHCTVNVMNQSSATVNIDV